MATASRRHSKVRGLGSHYIYIGLHQGLCASTVKVHSQWRYTKINRWPSSSKSGTPLSTYLGRYSVLAVYSRETREKHWTHTREQTHPAIPENKSRKKKEKKKHVGLRCSYLADWGDFVVANRSMWHWYSTIGRCAAGTRKYLTLVHANSQGPP